MNNTNGRPANERMSPKNQWWEDVFPIELVAFYGAHASFQGCIPASFTRELVRQREISLKNADNKHS